MIGKSIILFFVFVDVIQGASKSRPHPHSGMLEPYDGKPIPVTVSSDQESKLNAGQPVVFKDFKTFGGRGIVIQDINASPKICLDTICDIASYPKKVPRVKKLEIYEQKKLANGTMLTGARMDVSVVGARFSYFLKLKREPKYSTYTWTLDYKYNSDFDDNVGHWQVMKHPKKKDWSRVLYSTKVQLGAWVPKFVVNVIIKSALTESTTWVKRESEATARLLASRQTAGGPSLSLSKMFEGEHVVNFNKNFNKGVEVQKQALNQLGNKIKSSIDNSKKQFQMKVDAIFKR
eukprot:gene6181-12518_t